MTSLIIGALATFTVVIFVLACLPFKVAPKFAPLFTTAVAYGTLELYRVQPTLVEAAAVATLVAAASRYVVQELPKPWSWDDFVGRCYEVWVTIRKPRPKVKAKVRGAAGVLGNRVPKL